MSRKLLRRQKRNTNLLYLILIICIICLISVLILYQNTQNSNAAVIYGTRVTWKTRKTQYKHLKNDAYLKRGKLVTRENPAAPKISEKQYDKAIKTHETIVNPELQQLKALQKRRVKLVVDKHILYVTSRDFDKIEFEDEHVHISGSQHLKQRLKNFNSKYSTLHKTMHYKTVSGPIKTANMTYGWALGYQDLARDARIAFMNNKPALNTRKYIYGTGFIYTGTGYELKNHGLGDSYVLVNLKKQNLKIVKHGKLVLNSNQIVTGDHDKHQDTPSGTYYIGYKQRDAVLRGKNDDGSDYASPVSYWMPITQDGVGLHDSPWRMENEYSGNTEYLNNGSHGCINLEPSLAKRVWQLTYAHMPVVVH